MLFVARFLPGLRSPIFLTAGLTRKGAILALFADGRPGRADQRAGMGVSGLFWRLNRDWLMTWVHRGQAGILVLIGLGAVLAASYWGFSAGAKPAPVNCAGWRGGNKPPPGCQPASGTDGRLAPTGVRWRQLLPLRFALPFYSKALHRVTMQGFFTPLASRLARLRLAGILAITGKITGVERRVGSFAGRWRFAFHHRRRQGVVIGVRVICSSCVSSAPLVSTALSRPMVTRLGKAISMATIAS